MTSIHRGRVGILWRGDRAARDSATPENLRYRAIFAALAEQGVAAEPVVYDEAFEDEARAQLWGVAGVLVWVNPIQDGKDRRRLNALLRDVAASGAWVSAHPDVIDAMGVKEILYRTRAMGWGTDVERYPSFDDFRRRFPTRLAPGGPRVLKRSRGNDGQGVWKVERFASGEGEVVVREAHAPAQTSRMTFDRFLASCAGYFDAGEAIVDQPFQPRLREGMTRCYVCEDRVVGFAHQHPSGLMDPADMHPDAALGKRMFDAREPRFVALKKTMERDWIPQLMALLGLGPRAMPVIWDADFLYGPKDEAGADAYVLCEINVSSVFAVPPSAVSAIAQCVAERLADRRAPA